MEEVKESDQSINYKRSYRLSKHYFSIRVQHSNDIDHCIGLPGYQILLIFDSGDVMLYDMLRNKQIYQTKLDHEIKQAKPFDNRRIVYINTLRRRIEFFNFQTKQIEQQFNDVNLPTQQAMNGSDRLDADQVESLFKDGTKLAVLNQSKRLVILECQSAYLMNSNEVIVTPFTKEPQLNQSFLYTETEQKMLNISPINQIDRVAVWGQDVINKPVELCILNIKTHTFEKKFTLKEAISATIIQVQPWSYGKFAVFGNYNQGDAPILQIASYEISPAEEQTITLDLFGQSEEFNWSFTDVTFVDYEKRKIIWERMAEQGSYLDLYNPETNTITYSQYISQELDQPDLERRVSIDGKYIISYNSDIDEPNQRSFPFVVRSLVGLGTSLLATMDKCNLIKQYDDNIIRDVIKMVVGKK